MRVDNAPHRCSTTEGAERPLARLQGVTVVYPGPPPVQSLKHCELAIERGESVSIVGPSGSGKSTLLNVIGLLERPTEGVYEFQGSDTSRLTEGDRARVRAQSIGFVFQSFHLLDDRTANENVQLAMSAQGIARRRRRELAVQLLSEVGLAHRTDAIAGHLSGGDRQRVAVARALVGDPTLLLCDEPTGNLDSEATAGVLRLLMKQRERGVAVVVVTHDAEVASWASRSVDVRDGTVVEAAK
jgi:putative ABC transport system ATP-binding protein